MKKLYLLLSFVFIAATSCSDGEQGPQGPPGEPGLLGTVFDIEGDFTPANDYSLFVPYADFTAVEVFETDVVLVYLHVGTDGEAGGEPVDVWRLLPQTYYLDGGGSMQYNFDYTFFDTNIFLDANVDLATLGDEFTQNQIFRIAIVPAEFAENSGVDLSDYQAVQSALNLEQRDIPQLELNLE